jgi:hypothetical protein
MIRSILVPARVRIPRRRHGQSTVEYMLVIAVLVVALLAASSAFIGPFSQGFDRMSNDAGMVLKSGTRNGSGDQR